MSDFSSKRRQQFLSEQYYLNLKKHYSESPLFWSKNSPEADSPAQAASLASGSIADDLYALLSLSYAAGVELHQLRQDFDGVVIAYEKFAADFRAHEVEPGMAPIGFEPLVDYERIMQLIPLCYLLHRRDLLPRIAAMFDPAYAGEDTLYEDLLAYELEDRYDVDEWYHDKPYRDLINALYRDTPEESIADLKKHLKAWYPAMSKCPWHDSHLRMTATDGDYFGYWAFEAGAVAYLLELDDSEIDHMVYPKDLVAFAREFVPDEQVNRNENLRLRCEGGQPCPKDGWWWSPAAGVEGRRHFKQGEIMPIVESDYGDTIWQWDEQQNS